ncbi:MAG: hypothetical protein ACKVOH_00705 [Chlamydiales bacterium]
MKKILFLLFVPFQLFGLPVNNPKVASLACEGIFFDSCGYTPATCCDILNVRVGYYGDFTFNNYMQLADQDGSIRRTQIYTNAGEIDFNFWDRFEIYGVLGATNILVQAPLVNFWRAGTFSNSLINIQSESYFSWSVGVRGTIWECGRFTLGAEGQYFATNPGIKFVEDDFNSVSRYVNGESLNYSSWQGALGITYLIPLTSCFDFYPYLGGVYEGARLKMDGYQVVLDNAGLTIQLYDLKKERHWGYVVGGTLLGGERVMITTEGRFAYETALFFSIQMRL